MAVAPEPASPVKVSHRGQMSLPAELRRRWGLADGGSVAVVDLGRVAVVVPEDELRAGRDELFRVLLDEGGYERGLAMIDDPDLATQ